MTEAWAIALRWALVAGVLLFVLFVWSLCRAASMNDLPPTGKARRSRLIAGGGTIRRTPLARIDLARGDR